MEFQVYCRLNNPPLDEFTQPQYFVKVIQSIQELRALLRAHCQGFSKYQSNEGFANNMQIFHCTVCIISYTHVCLSCMP